MTMGESFLIRINSKIRYELIEFISPADEVKRNQLEMTMYYSNIINEFIDFYYKNGLDNEVYKNQFLKEIQVHKLDIKNPNVKFKIYIEFLNLKKIKESILYTLRNEDNSVQYLVHFMYIYLKVNNVKKVYLKDKELSFIEK